MSMYLWTTGQAERGLVCTDYFDRAEPWSQYPQLGAFHTSEVRCIFETLDVLHRAWQPIDFNIAHGDVFRLGQLCESRQSQ